MTPADPNDHPDPRGTGRQGREDILRSLLRRGGLILRRVTAGVTRRATNRLEDMRVRLATRHLQGPRLLRLADDQCVVVTMLRNAEYFLPEFLTYHRGLGVKHFLLIDNGSTDATLKQAALQEDVIVVSNTLPVARYECKLRANIARRIVRGGWFLFLDCDEMFEPPQGAGRPVTEIIGYCNRHGYTAVVCQMLDMVSRSSLQQTRHLDFSQSLRAFDQYAVSGLETFDYFDQGMALSWGLSRNVCDLPDVRIFFGGLRKEVFGENCCLTKHPLVRNQPLPGLYAHPHYSSGVVCADFTGLIRHYKFCGDYIGRETEQVARAVWDHGEDVNRMKRISGAQEFFIAGSQMKSYTGVRALREARFLVASQRFLDEAGVRDLDA